MGVNRYMSPIKTDYFQTYVDQYVPLPFETMMTAMGARQQVYDDTKANADALLLTHVNALDVDIPLREEILNQISGEVDNLVEQSGGDYSQLRSDIAKLSNNVRVNLLRGPLGAIQGQYDSRQAHVKQIMDSKMPESWKRAQLGKDLYQYEGTGGVYKGGQYSGRGPIDYVDMNEKVRKLADDVVEKKISQGKPWKMSDEGFYHVYNKRTDSWDIIDPSIVQQHVRQGLMNDPEATDFIGYEGDLFGYGESADRPNYIGNRIEFLSQNAGQTFGKEDHSYDYDMKRYNDWLDQKLFSGGLDKKVKGTVMSFEAAAQDKTLTYDDVIKSKGEATDNYNTAIMQVQRWEKAAQDHELTESEKLQYKAAQDALSEAKYVKDAKETLYNSFLEQSGWTPEKGASAFRDWMEKNPLALEWGTRGGGLRDSGYASMKDFEKVFGGATPEQISNKILKYQESGLTDYNDISRRVLEELSAEGKLFFPEFQETPTGQKRTDPSGITGWKPIKLNPADLSQGNGMYNMTLGVDGSLYAASNLISDLTRSVLNTKKEAMENTIDEKPFKASHIVLTGTNDSQIGKTSKLMKDIVNQHNVKFITQNGDLISQDDFQEEMIQDSDVYVAPSMDFINGKPGVIFSSKAKDKTKKSVYGNLGLDPTAFNPMGVSLIETGVYKKYELTPEEANKWYNTGHSWLGYAELGDKVNELNLHGYKTGDVTPKINTKIGEVQFKKNSPNAYTLIIDGEIVPSRTGEPLYHTGVQDLLTTYSQIANPAYTEENMLGGQQ